MSATILIHPAMLDGFDGLEYAKRLADAVRCPLWVRGRQDRPYLSINLDERGALPEFIPGLVVRANRND